MHHLVCLTGCLLRANIWIYEASESQDACWKDYCRRVSLDFPWATSDARNFFPSVCQCYVTEDAGNATKSMGYRRQPNLRECSYSRQPAAEQWQLEVVDPTFFVNRRLHFASQGIRMTRWLELCIQMLHPVFHQSHFFVLTRYLLVIASAASYE